MIAPDLYLIPGASLIQRGQNLSRGGGFEPRIEESQLPG